MLKKLISLTLVVFALTTISSCSKDEDKESKRTVYKTTSAFESGVSETCSGLDTTTLNSEDPSASETPEQIVTGLGKVEKELDGFINAFKTIDAPTEYKEDWKTVNSKINALRENVSQLKTQMNDLIDAQSKIEGITVEDEALSLQEDIDEIGRTVDELSTEFDTINSEIETLGTKLNIGSCFGV